MMAADNRKPKYNHKCKASPRKKAYSTVFAVEADHSGTPFPVTKCKNKANNAWVRQKQVQSSHQGGKET